MSNPILSIQNLTKIFYSGRRYFLFKSRQAPFVAVNHLSFDLKEGEILGILGSNGAGKTTTIAMLLGLLKPTSGTIRYFGMDFSIQGEEILEKISHASAYNKLPSSLTVQENLEIIGRLYCIPMPEIRKRISKLLDQFDMTAFKHKSAGSLSAGQMTRIMLIKAFLSHPKVVLLDEPTASLDPDVAFEVRQFILQQQKEFGVSIILTSHNMTEVTEVCDRVLVLQKGKIIQEDTPDNLAKSVALTVVSLQLIQNADQAIKHVTENHWHHTLVDGKLRVELDETKVPELLGFLGKADVLYNHIEIEKPSLEDYFLHISRQEVL